MGSDHSSHQKPASKSTQQDKSKGKSGDESANNSPGTSVCSDTELPYISYTVGRPIGDSPKAVKSVKPNERKPPRPTMVKSKRGHDIVVVQKAKATPDYTDEAMNKLNQIPTFLPIIHGSAVSSNIKDPSVQSGLDYKPLHQLCARYQAHLSACVQPLVTEQNNIIAKIKEIEMHIFHLHTFLLEKQRHNARNTERLSRVHELKHNLYISQNLLKQNLIEVNDLNMSLPEELRLETFEWKSEASH